MVVIAGPTAAGKSVYAVGLAEAHRGTIINADASQLYADIPILSAAPSAADRERVPHRLYGVVDGADACSAAAWATRAEAEIEAALADDRLPIVVGGSGLYLRTLIDGVADVPTIDPLIRDDVRAMTPPAAYARLAHADPRAAERLQPADRQRVMRALEVILSTGTPLADWQTGPAHGIGARMAIDGRIVDLPRAVLRERIAARFAAMLDAGGLDEAARLAERRLGPALPVMKALGVPQLLRALDGADAMSTAIAATIQSTVHYAKRQQTWFRNQTPGWSRP